MDRKLARHKLHRHKIKRYAAAAVAGAAIMTGIAFPGIQATKASAMEQSITSPPITNEQTTLVNQNMKKPLKKIIAEKEKAEQKAYNRNGWHEHKEDWPSPDDTHALYKDGHIYYHNNNDRYNDYERYGYTYYLNSPIEFVKSYATQYGFNPDLDSFIILSQSRHKATIQVIKHDTRQRFKVDLLRDHDHTWKITAIRGIGDATVAATYFSPSF